MNVKLQEQVQAIREKYGRMTVRAEGPLNDIVTLLKAMEELEVESQSLLRKVLAGEDVLTDPGWKRRANRIVDGC